MQQNSMLIKANSPNPFKDFIEITEQHSLEEHEVVIQNHHSHFDELFFSRSLEFNSKHTSIRFDFLTIGLLLFLKEKNERSNYPMLWEPVVT